MLRKTNPYIPKRDIDVVVLSNGGKTLSGSLIDESSDGIAVWLDGVEGLSIGRNVRVEFRRKRLEAAVTGINEDEAGYRVGFQLVT